MALICERVCSSDRRLTHRWLYIWHVKARKRLSFVELCHNAQSLAVEHDDCCVQGTFQMFFVVLPLVFHV